MKDKAKNNSVEVGVADTILHYWFGETEQNIIEGRGQLWFACSDEIDQQIQSRFGDFVLAAANGELDHWRASPRSCLALLVLLDQFTRNIYRGSGQAFASDPMALAICYDLLTQGFDRLLSASERLFCYLPLEHSEAIEDQRRCVQLFTDLAAEVKQQYGEQYTAMFKGYIDYAVDHHDIIAEFGRFPHRNELLGRESSQAELGYLQGGGKTFGQTSE